MLGELHMPLLQQKQSIVIGGKLGAHEEENTLSRTLAPELAVWAAYSKTALGLAADEDSPRGHDRRVRFTSSASPRFSFYSANEPDLAPRAAIRLAAPHGLQGTVSVDATYRERLGGQAPYQKPEQLRGTVWLGDGTTSPEPRVMGPTDLTASASTLILPLYTELPSNLGTVNGGYGAVGLLPYALHRAACSPPLQPAPGVGIKLSTLRPNPSDGVATETPTLIELEYYGLIPQTATHANALDVRYKPFTLGASDLLTERLFYVISGLTASQQRLQVSREDYYRPRYPDLALEVVDLYEGFFSFTAGPGLVLGTGAPADSDFLPSDEETTYYFTVYRCGTGGLPNPADVTQDGVVDGNDFIAFVNAFVALDALADVAGGTPFGPLGVVVGPDGIVDGSDFIAFINGYGAGCD